MEYLLLAFSVLLGACKSIVTKLARCPSGDLKGTAKINLISFCHGGFSLLKSIVLMIRINGEMV